MRAGTRSARVRRTVLLGPPQTERYPLGSPNNSLESSRESRSITANCGVHAAWPALASRRLRCFARYRILCNAQHAQQSTFGDCRGFQRNHGGLHRARNASGRQVTWRCTTAPTCMDTVASARNLCRRTTGLSDRCSAAVRRLRLGSLTGVAAGGGAMVRAEALASLVSTARSYWIRRS
jgi:hypothetical protein